VHLVTQDQLDHLDLLVKTAQQGILELKDPRDHQDQMESQVNKVLQELMDLPATRVDLDNQEQMAYPEVKDSLV